MISGWTEEHDELRDVVRRFLADRSSSEAVRAQAEAGAAGDPAVWRQLAEQLGLTGLAIPEEHGGAGMGPVELGVVLEEMGRTLYVGPYLSTVALAGQTLTAAGEAGAPWLPGIADGSLTATVAVSDRALSFDTSDVAVGAVEASEGWTLTGTKAYVVDGATAGLILIAAKAGDELALFAVEGDAAGVTRTPVPTVDITRAVARVELDAAPAVRLDCDAEAVLARASDLAAAALAAEQVGGASAALEMAVEYAKMRVQFGRPIGSFQAIKHQCADLLLQVESGRNAAFFAAALLAEGDDEGPVAASVAQAWCSTAYTRTSKQNIQIHGGIGYTWEHDSHLHLRRATASDVLLGAPRAHRSRIADLVGM
jgi:alkylation response protein AidB-like acyl-CoA dehydrogenase